MLMQTFFSQIFLHHLYSRLSVAGPTSYWRLETHQRILHLISNTWVIMKTTIFKEAVCIRIIILSFSMPGDPTCERDKPKEPGAQGKGTVLVSSDGCRQHRSHCHHHCFRYGGWRGYTWRTIQGSSEPLGMFNKHGWENRRPPLVVQEP